MLKSQRKHSYLCGNGTSDTLLALQPLNMTTCHGTGFNVFKMATEAETQSLNTFGENRMVSGGFFPDIRAHLL